MSNHPLSSLPVGGIRTVSVPVSAEHIRIGRKMDCFHCPVALAMQEVFPGYEPSVDFEVTLYEKDDDTFTIFFQANLPREAEDFITAFDKGGPDGVQPAVLEFAFTRLA